MNEFVNLQILSKKPHKMNYSKILEYKPFDFWDADSYITLCFELAQKKLKELYQGKRLDSCDCYGLYILDNNDEVIAQYTTGRMGVGPLAMRNENTKEIYPLCQN